MILIDNLRINTNKLKCDSDIICHLYTDGPIEELHMFANSVLGFENKEWFDDRPGREHYDIDSTEALVAIRSGAIQKLI